MNNLTERESGTSSEQSKFLALFQTVFCTSSVTLLTLSHLNQLGIQIGVEIFKYLFLHPERSLSFGRGSRVEGSTSRVEGSMSRVEGNMSRVPKLPRINYALG